MALAGHEWSGTMTTEFSSHFASRNGLLTCRAMPGIRIERPWQDLSSLAARGKREDAVHLLQGKATRVAARFSLQAKCGGDCLHFRVLDQ